MTCQASASLRLVAVAALAIVGAAAGAIEPANLIALSKTSPAPPWPAGDERGMANTLGAATTLRCGWHLSQRGATHLRGVVRALEHDAASRRSRTRRAASPSRPPACRSRRTPSTARPSTPAPSRSSRARRSTRSATSRRSRRRGIRRIRSRPTTRATTAATSSRTSSRRRIRRCSSSASRRSRRSSRPRCCSTRRRHVGKGKAMADGEVVTAAHIEAMLKAQGLGQARHPAGRHGVDLHRLERALEGPDDGAALLRDGAGPRGRRGEVAGEQAHRRDRPRRAVHRRRCPSGMLQGKAPPAAGHRARACRSRSTTTCCRCSASTTSRT